MTETSERLAQIIENDGNAVLKRTMRVVQSDVAALLGEFMDVKKLDLTVDRATGGGYILTFTVAASRIFDVGRITADE